MSMINFDTATIILLNLLRDALYAANAADGVHAPQASTFGEIATCLKRAIARSILDATYAGSEEADRIARRLYDEMIDNGEDIPYQIALFNEGIISI